MNMEIIHANAARAAGRYKRKCWWVDYEEVYQVASLAQIEAYSRFDESWGRPLHAYLWRAAYFAAKRSVQKASAPVSASHRPEVLIGLYRAPLFDDTVSVEGERESARRDSARRVRLRVASLLGEAALPFALGVITDEWSPGDVARDHGVPPSAVYAMQQQMIRVMSSDRELYELWKEME